ncbi:MAG: dTDP-glucose 4,6-dehydratase [Francisellaceae bacterium]|nr:dTDP-glucose 4,6-dehydratase [Francisellaceae bacterium]
MSILVTGGSGFIGSHFILDWVASSDELIINLDKLTYAAKVENLSNISNNPCYKFYQSDIKNQGIVNELLIKYRPRAVINIAAETHVDRSIRDPRPFIDTNILGTYNLLESTYKYWNTLSLQEKSVFRFLHISTDEVYGSLSFTDPTFTEQSPYAPNSPYSASKAASDHLVRSFHHTYGFPTITTHCSNNYGPFQFPEKFIPVIIYNAIAGNPIPIYGDGKNIRDWIYVGDHCSALRTILKSGIPGDTYNIGGENEKTNLDVAITICNLLDEINSTSLFCPHASLLKFVRDRPGHDLRYAINSNKIKEKLKWTPKYSFESGIRNTVNWYFNNIQ